MKKFTATLCLIALITFDAPMVHAQTATPTPSPAHAATTPNGSQTKSDQQLTKAEQRRMNHLLNHTHRTAVKRAPGQAPGTGPSTTPAAQ